MKKNIRVFIVLTLIVGALTTFLVKAASGQEQPKQEQVAPADTTVSKVVVLQKIQSRVNDRNERITELSNAIQDLQNANRDEVGMARGFQIDLADSVRISKQNWINLNAPLFPKD